MFIPAIDAFGVRQTVNANLSSAQTVWNLRSALNVAALNCLRPGDEPILTAYSDMLKSFARPLSATNRALDSEFRQKYGASYHAVRDQYMTQVYNYFALPPVMSGLCDTALAVSNEYLAAKPEDIDLFAANTLPRFEQRFLGFFGEYERWRLDVAAWDARYGAEHGRYYPAYVEAEQRRREAAAAVQIAGQPVPATGAMVIGQSIAVQPLPDPAAGATPLTVPVDTVVGTDNVPPEYSIPARAREGEVQAVSQPVVQPIGGEPAPLPDVGASAASGEQQPTVVSQPVVQQIPAGEE
jgi:hypothetical protein